MSNNLHMFLLHMHHNFLDLIQSEFELVRNQNKLINEIIQIQDFSTYEAFNNISSNKQYIDLFTNMIDITYPSSLALDVTDVYYVEDDATLVDASISNNTYTTDKSKSNVFQL